MTPDKTTTQEKNTPKRSGFKNLILLIVVAAGLTTAAIYVTGRLAGNDEDGAMPAMTVNLLDAIRPLAVGDMAALAVTDNANRVPEIGFIDGRGDARQLPDWKDRLVLLNLWATWCAPCLREMPSLDRLQARLGGDRFEVVAINVDKGGPEKGQNFYQELSLQNLGYYYDNSSEKIFRQLRAFGMPTTILVDGRGRELARMAGPAEWGSDHAVALIEAALAEMDK